MQALYFFLPIAAMGIFYLIFRYIMDGLELRRERIDKQRYNHCLKCNSRLSEWFMSDSGFMRCYDCRTVSPYRSHNELA